MNGSLRAGVPFEFSTTRAPRVVGIKRKRTRIKIQQYADWLRDRPNVVNGRLEPSLSVKALQKQSSPRSASSEQNRFASIPCESGARRGH